MSPPTNPSDNPVETNSTKRSADRVSEAHTSSSAQAQMLFTALRNVIIPLVQTALPTQKDLRDVPFGTEAEELLIALQNYIASIIPHLSHSESEDRTTAHPAVTLGSSKSMASSASVRSRGEREIALVPSISAPINLKQTRILTKTLSVLRQHVFDIMPIRLLRFETHQSKFEITLVEREQIYAELARKLQAEFCERGIGFDEDTQPGNINDTETASDKSESKSNENEELKNINDVVATTAQYSILSHTWLRGAAREVTYNDWLKRDFDTEQPGYQKLVRFCKAAAEYGFTYGWMDTICINKASSAELDESIRSMYKWYGKATVCIAYLAATTTLSDMRKDPWFTRGWTLQELIAPQFLKFYDMDWNKLVHDLFNDRMNPIILQHIESAAMISKKDMADLASVPISRKMQWAAHREVTRGEDIAYSLIGIFNVNITIAYGEGPEQAFFRLLREILNTTQNKALDIFNWAGKYGSTNTSLLPSTPKAYLHRSPQITMLPYMDGSLEPRTLTHLGLCIPILLLPATFTNNPSLPYTRIGDFYPTVDIKTGRDGISSSYNLLARGTSNSETAYAVLNFLDDGTYIRIPHSCFAVVVKMAHYMRPYQPHGIYKKLATTQPIVFKLLYKDTPSDTYLQYNVVKKEDLSRHGMEQINMIL